MQEQITDAIRFEYLVKTKPWPKEVYDAMVLQRTNQAEILDKYIQQTNKELL